MYYWLESCICNHVHTMGHFTNPHTSYYQGPYFKFLKWIQIFCFSCSSIWKTTNQLTKQTNPYNSELIATSSFSLPLINVSEVIHYALGLVFWPKPFLSCQHITLTGGREKQTTAANRQTWPRLFSPTSLICANWT